jgi:hypothetical protein
MCTSLKTGYTKGNNICLYRRHRSKVISVGTSAVLDTHKQYKLCKVRSSSLQSCLAYSKPGCVPDSIQRNVDKLIPWTNDWY